MKLIYKTARTKDEFEAYAEAYRLATHNELSIDVNFLATAYKVVYVCSENSNQMIAGFVLNFCETSCRYLAMLKEEDKVQCLAYLAAKNISITDAVECVAIFTSDTMPHLKRVPFFISAIEQAKKSGKKITLAGSYIGIFRQSLKSVYHNTLFAGIAANGHVFGLYFDFNDRVRFNMMSAVPIYFQKKISRQATKALSLLF